jgi:hypothetical protein
MGSMLSGITDPADPNHLNSRVHTPHELIDALRHPNDPRNKELIETVNLAALQPDPDTGKNILNPLKHLPGGGSLPERLANYLQERVDKVRAFDKDFFGRDLNHLDGLPLKHSLRVLQNPTKSELNAAIQEHKAEVERAKSHQTRAIGGHCGDQWDKKPKLHF